MVLIIYSHLPRQKMKRVFRIRMVPCLIEFDSLPRNKRRLNLFSSHESGRGQNYKYVFNGKIFRMWFYRAPSFPQIP